MYFSQKLQYNAFVNKSLGVPGIFFIATYCNFLFNLEKFLISNSIIKSKMNCFFKKYIFIFRWFAKAIDQATPLYNDTVHYRQENSHKPHLYANSIAPDPIRV